MNVKVKALAALRARRRTPGFGVLQLMREVTDAQPMGGVIPAPTWLEQNLMARLRTQRLPTLEEVHCQFAASADQWATDAGEGRTGPILSVLPRTD